MSVGRDEPAKTEAESDDAAERPLLDRWARIGEDYVVNRLIGRGGQSQIYEGYDTRNERLVAIKVFLFKHQLNATMLKRAKAEAKAEMRMVHPNIVKVHAAGVAEIEAPGGRKRELFYSVMEFLEGETLDDRIHRKGRLDVDEALSILAEAADGLAMLHTSKIIHRDIKPENIFLAKAAEGGAEPRVVLIDLGIAKLDPQQFSVQRTDSNILLGTFAYMSPEQIHHKCPVDGRADLYALGIVAFKCLTGVHPLWNHYEQPNPPPAEEYAAWHMTAPAPAVSTLRPDAPPAVVALVDRLLQKRPEDRYSDPQTASFEAAADLRELLARVRENPTPPPAIPMTPRLLAAGIVAPVDRWGPFGQATTQEDEGNDGPTKAGQVPVRLRSEPNLEPRPAPAPNAPAFVPPRTAAGTEILERPSTPPAAAVPTLASAGEPGEMLRTRTGTEIVPRDRLASIPPGRAAPRPHAEPVARIEQADRSKAATELLPAVQAVPAQAPREPRTTSGHLMSVAPPSPSRRAGWALAGIAGVVCGLLVLVVRTWAVQGGESANVAPAITASSDDAGAAAPSTGTGEEAPPAADPIDAGPEPSDAAPPPDAGSKPAVPVRMSAPIGQRACDFVRGGCAPPGECAGDDIDPRCNQGWAKPAPRGAAPKPPAPVVSAAPTEAPTPAPPKNKLPRNMAPQPLRPRSDRPHD